VAGNARRADEGEAGVTTDVTPAKAGIEYLTAHDEKTDSLTRQAGATITPAMVAAGVRAIAEEYGVCSEYVAEGLAEDVFRAMVSVQQSSADLGCSDDEEVGP
jgi:hypothetical protein